MSNMNDVKKLPRQAAFLLPAKTDGLENFSE
jgi:hypothetical protein